MIEQNLNPTPIPIVPTPPVEPTPIQNVLVEKAKSILTSLFNKFYSNKKIFWPVTVAVGLVVLVVILGLLLGKKGSNQNGLSLPTPTPFIMSTPVTSSGSDVINNSETRLNQLRDQINNLDVKQIRLQPPTLNFVVRF
jgi:hypothetical protein